MKKIGYEKKKKYVGFLLSLPWLIGFLSFFLIPMITSVRFGFSQITVEQTGSFSLKNVGFSNYEYLFLRDPTFIVSMIKTVISVFKDLFLVIAFSMFLALILVQEFRGRLVARAIFFLPVIVASGVVLGIINGDEYSQQLMSGASSQMQLDVLKNMLMNTGLSDSAISTVLSVVGNIFNITWHCGIQTLIFMSGLQAIPVSVKEAASVEGATAWEFFWKITFPMTLPMLQLNVIYTIIDSFTDSSNSIILRIFGLNQSMDYSYSSAIAWTYFVLIFVLVIVVYTIINHMSARYER